MWWINNVLGKQCVLFLVAPFLGTILIWIHVQLVTLKAHPEIALHDREHGNYNVSTLFRKISNNRSVRGVRIYTFLQKDEANLTDDLNISSLRGKCRK
jgi:hypothetical protein